MTSPETVACPFCESEIGANVKKCRHCGEWVSRDCEGCGTPIRKEWAARGLCVECLELRSTPVVRRAETAIDHRRSRGTAIVCALLLGGLGIHKFYLGKPGVGFFYLLFCWTMIPALYALFEGIGYAVMSEAEFQTRFAR